MTNEHTHPGMVRPRTEPNRPAWFELVDAEYRKLDAHPESIVMEPEQIEPLWFQAFAGAEASADDPDDQGAVEKAAARRTAAAIAILAYGPEYPVDAMHDPPATVRRALRSAELIVVNMEGDSPEILGPYAGTEEDAVFYERRGDAERGTAPQDCVRVMTRWDFDSFHAPATCRCGQWPRSEYGERCPSC